MAEENPLRLAVIHDILPTRKSQIPKAYYPSLPRSSEKFLKSTEVPRFLKGLQGPLKLFKAP